MRLRAEYLRIFRRPMAYADEDAALFRLETRLPLLLSIVAGMVDSTGFFTLGHVFTAHVTGNMVLAAGLAVEGGTFRWAQLLAIPIFMLALGAVWLVAQASRQHGASLARRLLLVQFLLLILLLIFSVGTKASADPVGVRASVAAMIAASAMACQYGLLRLALPGAISTAVMTGNLANIVLSSLDLLSAGRPLLPRESTLLNRSLILSCTAFILVSRAVRWRSQACSLACKTLLKTRRTLFSGR